MSYYYLNADKTYRECDLMEWANQFETIERHVAYDVRDDYCVSTVWLGLDHRMDGSDGGPLVFETMVFQKGLSFNDIYCQRYSTWQGAEEGHKAAIEWLNEYIKLNIEWLRQELKNAVDWLKRKSRMTKELEKIKTYWIDKYRTVDISLHYSGKHYFGKMSDHNRQVDLNAATIGELISQGEKFLRTVGK